MSYTDIVTILAIDRIDSTSSKKKNHTSRKIPKCELRYVDKHQQVKTVDIPLSIARQIMENYPADYENFRDFASTLIAESTP